MDNSMLEMQEKARRIRLATRLKQEFLWGTLIDTLTINAKSVMIAAVCTLAMITVFTYFQIDTYYLTPAGLILGFSVYMIYTRPKQNQAAFLRKLKLMMKLEEAQLIDLKNDLTKDSQ